MTLRDDERRKFEAQAKGWSKAVFSSWNDHHQLYEHQLLNAEWRGWLARAEQAETPRTREELEKEWLAQTEWQDFTNWLIHVKLGYVSVENCPSPSYTVCGAAMQFKCLSCGSTPAPTEPSQTRATECAEGWIACEDSPCPRHVEYWRARAVRKGTKSGSIPECAAVPVEDRPAPTPRPFGASFEDTGTVPQRARTPTTCICWPRGTWLEDRMCPIHGRNKVAPEKE